MMHAVVRSKLWWCMLWSGLNCDDACCGQVWTVMMHAVVRSELWWCMLWSGQNCDDACCGQVWTVMMHAVVRYELWWCMLWSGQNCDDACCAQVKTVMMHAVVRSELWWCMLWSSQNCDDACCGQVWTVMMHVVVRFVLRVLIRAWRWRDIHKTEEMVNIIITMSCIIYDLHWLVITISSALPRGGPELWGMKDQYDEGEWVDITCTTPPARPPPTITLAINGRQVILSISISRNVYTEHFFSFSAIFLIIKELGDGTG